MSKELLLSVKNLETHFTPDGRLVKAVDDVSFDVFSGETIGIVGESGSGKSVTALSIMGLVPDPPGSIVGGQILYNGSSDKDPVDLAGLPANKYQKYRGNEIAMIFQEPMTSLNPVFRCGEQVLEAILLHQSLNIETAKRKVLALFEKVELHDPLRIYNSYPHELSGGQKQRVMIAMALSCNPKLLIADEPTTALDVTVQKSILQLLNDLKAEINASVLFISHDLGVIAEIADRVLVMYKGRIVEQGSVAQIFKSPQHPYTKGLLACRPPLDYRLSHLPIISDFMNDGKGPHHVLEQFKVPEKMIKARLEYLQTQEPLLKVKNLKTWFPSKKSFLGKSQSFVKAVNDVSFEVYPGETLGLVGESGCGKTTLGRSILRLTTASAGRVYFKGGNIFDYSRNAMKMLRKSMQIIFQDPYTSLNPRMTVGQAILEPMKIHRLHSNDRIRKEKVIELLETVGLSPDQYSDYPHEFSGGQRQRIVIARALGLEPTFVICDECVSALDVSVQAQVLNLLIDLREKFGLTYVFISHDLSVVKFMSDRMIVMKDGRIVESGPSDDIYNNPQQAYTQQLIEAIPRGIY